MRGALARAHVAIDHKPTRACAGGRRESVSKGAEHPTERMPTATGTSTGTGTGTRMRGAMRQVRAKCEHFETCESCDSRVPRRCPSLSRAFLSPGERDFYDREPAHTSPLAPRTYISPVPGIWRHLLSHTSQGPLPPRARGEPSGLCTGTTGASNSQRWGWAGRSWAGGRPCPF